MATASRAFHDRTVEGGGLSLRPSLDEVRLSFWRRRSDDPGQSCTSHSRGVPTAGFVALGLMDRR